MMTGSSNHVTALERGLRLLSLFGPDEPALRLSELARRASLPASTTHRLLRTLESLGYVHQNTSGRYEPANAVLTLGFTALQANDAVKAAEEPLRRLSRRTGETTNFGVRLDDRVLYLIRFRTGNLNVLNLFPGSTLPLARTSMGKVLVAMDDTNDLEDIRNEQLQASSSELAVVRLRGWAVQDREIAATVRSVAVPIRSAGGLEGAINIAVDATRYSCEQMIDTLLPHLRRTASEINLRLGYLDAVLQADMSAAQSA